jgi:hypothetical protein
MTAGKKRQSRLKIPLKFDEAVFDLLKVKPPKKRAKKTISRAKGKK